MPNNLIASELQTLSITSPLVTLFQLILTEAVDGTPVKSVYFTSGQAQDFSNITFRDFYTSEILSATPNIQYHLKSYTSLPLAVSGISVSDEGSQGRPTLQIANVSNVFTEAINTTMGLNWGLEDLLGKKVVIRNTQEKYLSTGSATTPPTELPRHYFIIDRLSSETNKFVSFELSSPYDLETIQLPRRAVHGKYCSWQYRGYYGSNYPQGPNTIASGLNVKTKKGGCTWSPAFRNYAFPAGISYTASNFVKTEFRPYFTLEDEPLVLIDYLVTEGSIYSTGGTQGYGQAWNSSITYTTSDYVKSNNKYYLSKINANQNNNPSTLGDIIDNPYWQLVYTYTVWDTDTTGTKAYAVGDYVEHNFTVWRCEIAHTKQATTAYTPDDSTVIWTRADACGKTLNSCKKRFGAISATPAQTYHVDANNNDGTTPSASSSSATFLANGAITIGAPFFNPTATTAATLFGRPDSFTLSRDSANVAVTTGGTAGANTSGLDFHYSSFDITGIQIVKNIVSGHDLILLLLTGAGRTSTTDGFSYNVTRGIKSVLISIKRNQSTGAYSSITKTPTQWTFGSDSAWAGYFSSIGPNNHLYGQANLAPNDSAASQSFSTLNTANFIADNGWIGTGNTTAVALHVALPFPTYGTAATNLPIKMFYYTMQASNNYLPTRVLQVIAGSSFNSSFTHKRLLATGGLNKIFVSTASVDDHGYDDTSWSVSIFPWRKLVNSFSATGSSSANRVILNKYKPGTAYPTESHHIADLAYNPAQLHLTYLEKGHFVLYEPSLSSGTGVLRFLHIKINDTINQSAYSISASIPTSYFSEVTPTYSGSLETQGYYTPTIINNTNTLIPLFANRDTDAYRSPRDWYSTDKIGATAAYDFDTKRLMTWDGYRMLTLRQLSLGTTTSGSVNILSKGEFALPDDFWPTDASWYERQEFTAMLIFNKVKSTFYFKVEFPDTSGLTTKLYRLPTFGTQFLGIYESSSSTGTTIFNSPNKDVSYTHPDQPSGNSMAETGTGTFISPIPDVVDNIKLSVHTNSGTYDNKHISFAGISLQAVTSNVNLTNYVVSPQTYTGAAGLIPNENYYLHDTGEISTSSSGPNKTSIGVASSSTGLALGDPSSSSSFTGVNDVQAALGRGGASAVSFSLDETVALPFGGFPGLDKFQ